ncbi:PTS glucose transporter subunit IIA [Orbus sturtevantii]|uniref:PTS sugar transporter subunit IIA n=1 Tax=Orbus sturtevantii TaxID=3074109 RepID=UPI00370DC4FA
MFGLFKKKKKSVELFAVCDGTFKSIEKVNDTVFADKIMGDGFAVSPTSGKVSVNSPIKGKILSIFPTKHAITFVTDEGIEGLVHMGIDTVALKGDGFVVDVEEGQKVDQNTRLAQMDVDFIAQQNKDCDIIVVFTNLDNKKLLINQSGKVQKAQLIGGIEL